MIAKYFIVVGFVFIILGLFLYVAKDFSLFRLPGDIVIEKENFKFYFPITSSIILSILFSLIFTIISKFFR